MTNDERHDELRDDLAAYALGALDDAEAASVESHLETCESCTEWLRWLDPAVAVLPASVEQTEPPPELRDRVLGAIRDAEPATGLASSSRAASRRRWSLALPRPAIALAACALLAVALAGGYLIGESGDSEGPDRSLTPALALGGDRDRISASLERSGETATLHVEEMPKLDADRVYEVWIDRGGRLEPSTLFVLDSEGRATAAVPVSLEGADRILVTAEPRGGSRQPSGAPLLEVPL